jgi:hypothetical protein
MAPRSAADEFLLSTVGGIGVIEIDGYSLLALWKEKITRYIIEQWFVS